MREVKTLLQSVHLRQAEFDRARVRLASSLAPEFSLFHFIDANEIKLSNIIAWLLNPIGSHGQGERFLRVFVEQFQLGWDETACIKATVKVEAATSWLEAARRIDILVQSGGMAIAIENKPSAADQHAQVQDYLTHLDQEFREGRCLIYLSSDGSPPSESSISAEEAARRVLTNELVVIGYGDLLPWISACRSTCSAQRVSYFLDEFHLHIQKRFLKVRDMTELDQIVSEMSASSEAVSAAFKVINAADELKSTLIKNLAAQLKDLAGARGWLFSPKTPLASSRSGVAGSGFLFKFHQDDKVSFAAGFANDQRSFFAYGVNAVESNSPSFDRINAALTTAFGPAETWLPLWPWGKGASRTDQQMPIERDWNISDWPWRAIADGSLALIIVDAAERFRVVLAANKLIGVGSLNAV